MLAEALWPRVWVLIGLLGLFLAVSLVGLWARLDELTHKLVLGLFGLAVLGTLIALDRVRWPDFSLRDRVLTRLE